MARRKNVESDAKIGHNSNRTQDEKRKLGGFIAEIETLEANSRELASDRGNIYKAAKEQGFDTKALREVIRRRRMDKSKRDDFLAAVDAYMHALGDFVTTPLGQAGLPAHA